MGPAVQTSAAETWGSRSEQCSKSLSGQRNGARWDMLVIPQSSVTLHGRDCGARCPTAARAAVGSRLAVARAVTALVEREQGCGDGEGQGDYTPVSCSSWPTLRRPVHIS